MAYLPGIQFALDKGEPIPTGWFHLTMVYHAVEPYFDFSLFIDGHEITTQILMKYLGTPPIFVEAIRIGLAHTESTEVYGSVTVDDVVMWNRELDADEVQAVYDMYSEQD